MTELAEARNAKAGVSKLASAQKRSIRKRDWLLLPLLSLATLAIVVTSTEVVARKIYRQSSTSTLSCLVLNDAKTGVRGIPNAVCSEKIFESGLVQYKFNDCGYRTGQSCSVKAPGTFRIVLLGSSLAEGMRVSQDQIFASKLPLELSRISGRKVEIYNEAMQWGTPTSIALRADDIFAAKPDLVLWTITPWDIENVSLILPYIAGVQGEYTGGSAAPEETDQTPKDLESRVIAAFRKRRSPLATVRAAWLRLMAPLSDTRTAFMLQHLLYKSQSQFIRNYLMQGDSAGYLRVPASDSWNARLSKFDQDFKVVAAKTRSAGIPLVVVLLPDRAQAILEADGTSSHESDPEALGRELKPIVQRDGGIYIDVLHDFRDLADPEELYLPIDGHLDSEGHTILSNFLAKELTDGAVAALSGPSSGYKTEPRSK